MRWARSLAAKGKSRGVDSPIIASGGIAIFWNIGITFIEIQSNVD